MIKKQEIKKAIRITRVDNPHVAKDKRRALKKALAEAKKTKERSGSNE